MKTKVYSPFLQKFKGSLRQWQQSFEPSLEHLYTLFCSCADHASLKLIPTQCSGYMTVSRSCSCPHGTPSLLGQMDSKLLITLSSLLAWPKKVTKSNNTYRLTYMWVFQKGKNEIPGDSLSKELWVSVQGRLSRRSNVERTGRKTWGAEGREEPSWPTAFHQCMVGQCGRGSVNTPEVKGSLYIEDGSW